MQSYSPFGLDPCLGYARRMGWRKIAFPIPEDGKWPRHGHGIYLRPDYIHRTPPFLLTWAGPIFEQGALSPMSVLPADFPILCLPGDKLFQSKDVEKAYCLPSIVHAFHGSKVDIGKKLQQWQWQGLRPLAVALIGVDQLPPLWTHPTGSDFVRGSKLVAKPHVAEQRKLTQTQVLLPRACGRQLNFPITATTTHPGPKPAKPPMSFVDSKPACNSPLTRFALLEALQKRLQIDSSKPELAINEILASHADPKYHDWKKVIMENTGWQLNPTDTGYLDVQCTGLGGEELDRLGSPLGMQKRSPRIWPFSEQAR